MSNLENLPTHLSHKPILAVDYQETDKNAGAGDAIYLSLGRSTWNGEDLSAKIFRWADNDDGGRWSRQSEELPLWRVLDLTKLLIATITGQKSTLNEDAIDGKSIDFLKSYISENMELYLPRIREIGELIEGAYKSNSNAKSPNIFSYATSELSQDAVLSWMIKWADDTYLDEDREMCLLGKSLVSLLTDLNQEDIHTVNVGRQWCNIDIWAEINDDTILIIEDKTGTTIHGNQLGDYKITVEKEYSEKREKRFYSYVKTGNESQSFANFAKENGYKPISRIDLLKALNKYGGRNPIVIDFRKHLQQIEDETNNYKNVPVDKWREREWQGFYMELERHLVVDNWDYVPNPAGGFWGLWWHFIGDDEVRMYLQFEQSKLCVKIEYEGETRSEVREKYHNLLMQVAHENDVIVERPSRFGSGTYMTIGVVPAEVVFGSDIVNVEEVVKILKKYERIVNICMKVEK